LEGIIFIGIQATGKSTFYKQQFFNTHMRISLDLLNTRNKELTFLKTCLELQQRVVIDNTNVTVKDREKYIQLFKDKKYDVTGYYFESKIKDAKDRNNNRNEIEIVPEVGLLGTYNKLELPNYSEGFDRLFYVKIENNNFRIEEWQNEV
jgi:predicted kinase